MSIFGIFKKLISGVGAEPAKQVPIESVPQSNQASKAGADELQYSERDVQAIQMCAESTLRVFTESLNIANNSKNIKTRESRLQVARDKLIELKKMEKKFPFLHLENLQAVEASIEAVEAETQEMRTVEPKPKTTATIEELKDFYRKKAFSLNTAEKNTEYYRRNYPDDLSKKAWCKEIAKLPITEQCRQLDILHEKIDGLTYGKKPEIDALNYFNDQGFLGTYCEGGAVLLLIRAAALDILAQFNFLGRSDACTRFTEAQLVAYKESSELILTAIRNTDKNQVICNFNEIYMHQRIPGYYPGLNADIISSLFAAIGAERLAQITAAIMENPYLYRAGWPDLTMIKDSDMFWVEVKTNDRLHISQIMTISRMKPLLPGNVSVVQLVKTRSKRQKVDKND